MRMIVAVGQNFEIGKGNDLPWKCPADLQLFKELTHGFTVIMGRKTAESLGRPLPGRRNVMLTHGGEAPSGFHVASLARCLREFPNSWVIGAALYMRRCFRMSMRSGLVISIPACRPLTHSSHLRKCVRWGLKQLPPLMNTQVMDIPQRLNKLFTGS